VTRRRLQQDILDLACTSASDAIRQPCTRRDAAGSLGLGDVRFRQLRLYHRRHHCGLQRLLRGGGRRQPAVGNVCVDRDAGSVLRLDHAHRTGTRGVRGCLRKQEEVATRHHHRLRGLHRLAGARQPGRTVDRDRLSGPLQLLLRHRRESHRRVLAGDCARGCFGPGLRMGLGTGLHRRPGESRRLSCLRDLGSG
jgi:hypothetical protein